MKKPRKCGTCTACCTTHSIPELDKPVATPCPKLGDKGCSIYGQHPQSCKDFKCLWLLGAFEGSQRPDRLGIVFDCTEPRNGVQSMVARELWAGAFDSLEAQRLFDDYSQKVCVIRIKAEDQMRSIIGPAALVRKAIYGE